MIGWRICKRGRARTAFDGQGAARYPGRWNRKGVPVVYAASSLSLAMLEYLVHVDPDEWPDDLVSMRFEIPAEVKTAALDRRTLPAGWRASPAPEALKSIGAAWAIAATSALLAVPSAITPSEANWLINPRHPDAGKLVIDAPERLVLDARLRKRATP